MLNKKVSYQGRESTWEDVIFLKVRELAHYLTSKKEISMHLTFFSLRFAYNTSKTFLPMRTILAPSSIAI